MQHTPPLVSVYATTTLQLAVEKMMQHASDLSPDEFYDLAALRLQLALAIWHAARKGTGTAELDPRGD